MISFGLHVFLFLFDDSHEPFGQQQQKKKLEQIYIHSKIHFHIS